MMLAVLRLGPDTLVLVGKLQQCAGGVLHAFGLNSKVNRDICRFMLVSLSVS